MFDYTFYWFVNRNNKVAKLGPMLAKPNSLIFPCNWFFNKPLYMLSMKKDGCESRYDDYYMGVITV